MTHSDVIILGGGPSGTAAALELARNGVTVTVLERSRYADRRIGDTLAPETTPWLKRLGIWEEFQSVPRLPSLGVVSLWNTWAPVETDFLFNPFGNGWHLDRTQFDAMMARTAESAGVMIVRGAVPKACRHTDSGVWLASVAVDGTPMDFTGRWLLDATGRRSWFLRRQGIKVIAWDRLVGVIAQVERGPSTDLRLFVEAVANGWWYYAPLPGGRAIVAYMTDSDLLPRDRRDLSAFWDREWIDTRLISSLGSQPLPEKAVRVVAAHAAWSGTVSGPRWLAVGDAAIAHDPLSGYGICQALESGWRAACAVIASFDGDSGATEEYQRWAETIHRNYRTEHARFYSSVTRWPESPFWKRRTFANQLVSIQ